MTIGHHQLLTALWHTGAGLRVTSTPCISAVSVSTLLAPAAPTTPRASLLVVRAEPSSRTEGRPIAASPRTLLVVRAVLQVRGGQQYHLITAAGPDCHGSRARNQLLPIAWLVVHGGVITVKRQHY
jgi:hypothetical protein